MESSLRWATLLVAIVVLPSGCCSISVDYGPTPRGPAFIPSAHESFATADACSDGCGGCESPTCGINGMHGLHHLKHGLANWHRKTVCSSGCGEVYWDEQINEPPTCDPCGCDGQWAGGTYGSCRPWYSRLRDLWGHPYYPSSCSDCSDCGVVHGHSFRESSSVESVIRDESVSTPSDHPVPTPAKPKEPSVGARNSSVEPRVARTAAKKTQAQSVSGKPSTLKHSQKHSH